MRSFMDDVVLQRAAGGGMEVRMTRSWRLVADPIPPVFLATAIESVIRAGEVQMAHFGGDVRVDKKGRDRPRHGNRSPVERDFRARIAERFPTMSSSEKNFRASPTATRYPDYCWVFDPIDGTTNYAHGVPIFCSSLALEIRGVPSVAAVYDPSRKELFTAERGAGAWLNGAPLRVSAADALINRCSARDSLQRSERGRSARSCVCGISEGVPRGQTSRVRGHRSLLRRGRAVRRVLGARAASLGRRRGCAHCRGGGRTRDESLREILQFPRRKRHCDQRPHS
jgi:fructose-1,6-bisphosphatase/inositol monophosphatase family enzyme